MFAKVLLGDRSGDFEHPRRSSTHLAREGLRGGVVSKDGRVHAAGPIALVQPSAQVDSLHIEQIGLYETMASKFYGARTGGCIIAACACQLRPQSTMCQSRTPSDTPPNADVDSACCAEAMSPEYLLEVHGSTSIAAAYCISIEMIYPIAAVTRQHQASAQTAGAPGC